MDYIAANKNVSEHSCPRPLNKGGISHGILDLNKLSMIMKEGVDSTLTS